VKRPFLLHADTRCIGTNWASPFTVICNVLIDSVDRRRPSQNLAMLDFWGRWRRSTVDSVSENANLVTAARAERSPATTPKYSYSMTAERRFFTSSSASASLFSRTSPSSWTRSQMLDSCSSWLRMLGSRPVSSCSDTTSSRRQDTSCWNTCTWRHRYKLLSVLSHRKNVTDVPQQLSM